MKRFARLATLSLMERRVVKYTRRFFVIAACCIASIVNVHGQSVFPVGTTPPELTNGVIILDTLRIDSVTGVTCDTFITKPNILLADHFFPGYSGSDPQIWGPLVFVGHTFNITFEGDPDYFATFPSQPVLLQWQYSLKVYAPGDTVLTTPIYQNDSIFLVMNSATPRVDYRLDLSGLFAQYLPQRALLNLDTVDVTSFVADLVDSIVAANKIGEDSVNLGGTKISFVEALYILDSANLVARGVSTSLMHNNSMHYTLTYISAGSYAYSGFNPAGVGVYVIAGHGVAPSPWSGGGGGGILPIRPGTGVQSVPTDGKVIVFPCCPSPGPSGPCTLPFEASSVVLSNPAQLNWSDCPFVNYEIQVLRLYNIDGLLTSDPHDIEAKIDWSQALDIETNDGQTSVKLTLAEGSGYYVWRVRRIADVFPNTIGDDRNWGPWTNTGPFVDGAVVPVDPTTPTAAPYFFYYDVFDDTLNYIYHRQFVEGEVKHGSQFRVGEKTTFANYLLMPVQEQVKAQTADSILSSQTLPDNNGRPMMQTMSATVQKNGFGYEYDYIKNSVGGLYTAADFDEQANYNIPSLVDGASKLVWYYSDANVNDPQVPACDSIPFSRTLNYNDPLNRPREIVSPGKYHNFGSGHSIKKYYCAATTTELVRIFGDEAPRSESVLKTYTMDQNQVLSVSYTDKVTDKILATCLSAPQSELLDEIESDPFTVYDTVTAKTPGYMPSRLIETKTYTFPLPTTLNYIYQITADVIGDSCAGICATCDYIVTISCRNIDDTNATHMYRDTLVLAPTWDTSGSMPCIPVSRDTATTYALIPIGLGTTPTTTLPEGTYVVTATILLGNKNPLTGRTYLRELDTLLVRKLHNRLMTTGGTVIGGYSGVTLTNVYGYLAGNNMDGLLAYTGADTTQPTFDLVVGCDTFTLPTERCPKHSCTVIDFAEHMVAQLAQYDVDHGTSTYSGVSDINNIVDAANHLFWVQDDAHFNQVIFNMIDSGYDCDTLWNCWVSTVDWFAAAQHNNITTFPGAPMMDWWQHFMDLAEYKLPFTPRPTAEFGSGASTTTYIHQAPFRYFPYDTLTNATAESAFCFLYETEYLGVPPSSSCPISTTYWMNLIPNYPTYSATSPFHMYNFYLSIKPSSTTYITSVTGAGLGSFGGGTPATYASMSDACYRMCDSRYNHIADAVAHKYMKEGGIFIEGEPYMSWYPDPPRDTMELSHVYCIASALVGKCKEGCVLTPDPVTGVVPSSQILAYQKSMTYSMKFLVTLSDTSGPCGVSYGGEHDSVISVIRYDSVENYPGSGIWTYTPYYIDSIIKVVGDSSIIDSSYVSVCNADTNYSYNQAMLDWLNNRYMQLYDSMRAPWTATPYDWYFMSSPGMGSFGGAGFGCTGSHVQIYALSPPGHFSYDTLRTTTTTCTSENFTVTRTKPRKAFINSTMTMEVDVVLTSGGALASTADSIVVVENIPLTGTVVSTNGQIGASTIRFAAGGPMAVGGVIKFRYDILMPSITGTDVIFGGSVVRHTYSVTPSSCAMVPDTTTADTCMELFFVPGGTITDPISPLCTSCWSPMDCHACICFHYEHPSPTAATDSVHVFTCEETVCSTFVNSLNTQVRNIKDKHCEILKIDYDTKCNDPDNIKDMFVNSFDLDHFQYTLYYYDRAGNLIRTVAPRGVLDTGTGRYAPVGHYDYDVTKYEYNTLGQLERQTTPDGGTMVFAYDKRGKVRLSRMPSSLPAPRARCLIQCMTRWRVWWKQGSYRVMALMHSIHMPTP
jgi:YD repeat-containing protein